MLKEANALLNAVAGGTQAPDQAVQDSIEGLTALGFVCDESGCVLVLPHESSDEEGECSRAAGAAEELAKRNLVAV